MKTNLLIFIFALLGYMAFSQPPQAINYQGVARDSLGHPLVSKNISLQLSILDSSATGNAIYVETHSTLTSGSGLFDIYIGNGNVTAGNFSTVPWGQGSKWLKVEMDVIGGNNYQLIGTTKFLSVPYALFSGKTNKLNEKYSNDPFGSFDLLFLTGVFTTPNSPIAVVPNNKIWRITLKSTNISPSVFLSPTVIYGEWWIKPGDTIFSGNINGSLPYFINIMQFDTCSVNVKTFKSPGQQLSVCVPLNKIWKLVSLNTNNFIISIPNYLPNILFTTLFGNDHLNGSLPYYFEEGTCFENIGTQPMYFTVFEFKK